MRLSAWATIGVMCGLLCISGSRTPETCEVTLKIVDAQTGGELPGLVRIRTADGDIVSIHELLPRGAGLSAQLPINQWRVLPKSTTVQLPRQPLLLEAISGLETERAEISADFTKKSTAGVTFSLTRFHRPRDAGFYAGNTHLHLQKLSREECDRYLQEVPRGDGLDVLFLSYLERAVADRDYTSNDYTGGDLQRLKRTTGVVFGNGEEHRHNFDGFGQGYGHVMLLDIRQLIQPVSIGPGIMKQGTDGIPLQRGLDAARRDGATTIWCHNNWGVEAVPNFVTGRIDAQNIFDGGTHGSYKDSFYRYLNAGLKVPFSTGTDWFMYDFSRVYVEVRGELTVSNWLKGLGSGRGFITNGPLLELKIDHCRPGDVLELPAGGGTVRIRAAARGRRDFGRVELIHNGEVIAQSNSRPNGGHFEAVLDRPLKVGGPCWLALRTPPSPVEDDVALTEAVGRNLLGRELFAHTSAVYVEAGGRSHFNPMVARALLDEMRTSVQTIADNAIFADRQERERVLDVYRDGMAVLEERLRLEQRAAN